MEFLLFSLIGIAVGYILTRLSIIRKNVGVLKIETSDPDGPFFFLELSKEPTYVQRQKYVILSVDTNGYLNDSQK